MSSLQGTINNGHKYYPRVILNQYPQGIYRTVIASHPDVMDKYEIRRENLRALISQAHKGNQSAFGLAVNKPGNYISRCLSTSPNPKNRKNIGEDFAREIETKFRLSKYAMDTPGAVAEELRSINQVEEPPPRYSPAATGLTETEREVIEQIRAIPPTMQPAALKSIQQVLSAFITANNATTHAGAGHGNQNTAGGRERNQGRKT